MLLTRLRWLERLSWPANSTNITLPWPKFLAPLPSSQPPATSWVDFSSPIACSKCSRPAGRKKHESTAEQPDSSRSDLSDRCDAVHFVAEVAEFSLQRATRRTSRRNRHASRRGWNSFASRHRGLHLDRDCVSTWHGHRCSAGLRANDCSAAANSAESRFRRTVRDAGRHCGILFARTRRAEIHDGGPLAGNYLRFADIDW